MVFKYECYGKRNDQKRYCVNTSSNVFLSKLSLRRKKSEIGYKICKTEEFQQIRKTNNVLTTHSQCRNATKISGNRLTLGLQRNKPIFEHVLKFPYFNEYHRILWSTLFLRLVAIFQIVFTLSGVDLSVARLSINGGTAVLTLCHFNSCVVQVLC